VGTDTTRTGTRYGCFLPDLTGLANGTSTPVPARHMAIRGDERNHGPRPRMATP
jgi:hypothetical protein